ncbi:hypothetical protein FQZ97_1184020 [compost metagenome]
MPHLHAAVKNDAQHNALSHPAITVLALRVNLQGVNLPRPRFLNISVQGKLHPESIDGYPTPAHLVADVDMAYSPKPNAALWRDEFAQPH